MNEVNKTTAPQQRDNATKTATTLNTVQPFTDIYEANEGATLFIDLPGVSKESLEIDVDQNVLTVRGSITLDMPENLQPTYMDIRSGRYERQFTLGEKLEANNIVAQFNQGVLKLFIPRSEQHKPRKIEITTA